MLTLIILFFEGCALLFCNVLPNGDADLRVAHRECTLEEGLRKYGVNLWISGDDVIQFILNKSAFLPIRRKEGR